MADVTRTSIGEDPGLTEFYCRLRVGGFLWNCSSHLTKRNWKASWLQTAVSGSKACVHCCYVLERCILGWVFGVSSLAV